LAEPGVEPLAEPLALEPQENAIILGEGIPGEAPQGGASVFVIIRMVLVLALAAGAIYGVVFFLRRASRPQEQRNPHLKILTSAHLGSNRFVYVVSVGAKAWLIGAGEGGVSLISELTDQELIDGMVLEDSRKGAESSRFSDFRALLRKFGGGAHPDGGLPEGLSAANLRKNRERIKRL
jgi:flagellar protein FliO/FliZ